MVSEMTSSKDTRIKCLTLTFNPNDRGRSGVKQKPRTDGRVGFSPQNRQSVKVLPWKKFQQSSTSCPSATYYRRKLNSDIDELLLEDDQLIPPTRPSSAVKSTSDKVETEYLRLAQSLLSPHHPLLTSRASSSIAPQSFLIEEFTNKPCTDLDEKLGRPTRTTLLRNRQRCNSAPISSYGSREELKLRNQLIANQRSRPSTARRSQEPVSGEMEKGESLHSFLIGARYNRANYVDAKSLMKYGVYMPRRNPHACFVNENRHKSAQSVLIETNTSTPSEMTTETTDDVRSGRSDDTEPTPTATAPPTPPTHQTPAPPSTPANVLAPPCTPTAAAWDVDANDSTSSHPKSIIKPRQAWGDDHHSDHRQFKSSTAGGQNGLRLNITGKKLAFGTQQRPLAETAPTNYLRPGGLASSAPPPSIDLSNSHRLDIPASLCSPRHRQTALSDHHPRSVRFSEPDEFGVVGKSWSTPPSPKRKPLITEHSETVTDSKLTDDTAQSAAREETDENVIRKDSVNVNVNVNVPKFFMTEEPEKPEEFTTENVDKSDIRIDNSDVKQGDTNLNETDAVLEDDVVDDEGGDADAEKKVEVADDELDKPEEEVVLQKMEENGNNSDDEGRGAATPMPVTSVDINVRQPDSVSQ